MLAVALIIIVVAIAFVLGVGGKATKGGGVKAELLGAEASTTSGNTILSIATNLPLTFGTSVAGNVVGAGNPGITALSSGPYNVSGGYEYVFSVNSAMSGSISSITVTGATGTILLLPASGTSVPVESGTAPFAITSIGSG